MSVTHSQKKGRRPIDPRMFGSGLSKDCHKHIEN